MYICMSPFRFDPTREQENLRFTEERLLPAVRQLAGFRRYTMAADRVAGHGLALTEWDELEQAQHFQTVLGGGLVQEIADQSIHVEAGQVYEVLVET